MKQVKSQRREEGDTIPGQKAAVRRFLESRPDWELLPQYEYVEPGVSAFKKRIHERPVLLGILDAAKAGEFDALCVFREDRLSRGDEDSGAELLYILSELERAGVKVWSVSDQKHLTVKGTQLVIRAVEADTANQESKKTSARVRNGRTTAAETGRWSGGRLSFGYTLRARIDSDGQPALRGGRVVNDIIPHPEHAPVVREIFDRYLHGEGTHKIAGWLNTTGIPSFTGKGWDTNGVKHLLRNRFYVGEVALHHSPRSQKKGDTAIHTKGDHEPIVDLDTFDTAAVVQQRRRRIPSRQLGSVYALGGVAYCQCGARLGGITRTKKLKSGEVGVYGQQYRCRAWAMRGTCPVGMKHVHADEVERNFLDELEWQLVHPKGIRRFLEEQNTEAAVRLQDYHEHHKQAAARLVVIADALKRLHRGYLETGTITDAVYTTMTGEYEAERLTLQAVLDETPPVDGDTRDFATLADQVTGLKVLWPRVSPDERRQLVMNITAEWRLKVTVLPSGQVEITAA